MADSTIKMDVKREGKYYLKRSMAPDAGFELYHKMVAKPTQQEKIPFKLPLFLKWLQVF